MSYYLCLSVSDTVASPLAGYFEQRVYLTDASRMPIGIQTNMASEWRPYLMQVGSSSASLIGKGGIKRTRNNDHRHILVDGVNRILSDHPDAAAAVVVHWMTGRVDAEAVGILRDVRLNIREWTELGGELFEDVRYIISATGSAN